MLGNQYRKGTARRRDRAESNDCPLSRPVIDTHVKNTKEEAPPSGKDHESGSVLKTAGWRIIVVVVVGHKSRSNDSSNERDNGEEKKDNGVSPADGGGEVRHCGEGWS